MQTKLSWDDLLHVLSVGRAGSLAGAARELGVNHSTMFRRIGSIEERLGVRLFDRRRDGYIPTPAGEAVVTLAASIDEEVVALERRLAGEDLRPSGTVRLTTTETLSRWVVPMCGRFADRYPDIVVDLVIGNQMLNLSRREADVALRPSLAPPESLHGRRIGQIAFAPYAAVGRLSPAAGFADDPDTAAWIGFDDSLSHLGAFDWLRRNVAPERIAFRASSLNAVLQAAAAGIGVALLPCYMGDSDPLLRRFGDPVPGLRTDLWLLVHEDLRRTSRVRALTDHLFDELTAMRPLLEGRCGSNPVD